MKIIAVIGLPGSGKSELISYLIEKYHWPKVYFGDVTFDEMKRRELPINEKNERMVREELREKYGKLHYADKVIEKIESLRGSEYVIVESLYMWEEYLRFKEEFGDDFVTIAVYASPKTRYNRLMNREYRPLTEEESKSRDYAQIGNLSQGGPIAMADYLVVNEGTKEELVEKTDKVIKNINK
ncbi:MAG: AAA family ATPase [Candidatus Moranbacteria bacterium]|nr:AAA family ATPase [Candidatus Moranbacteria bacterium]